MEYRMNSCKWCSGQYIAEDIPIKSNADLSRTFCIIAQGSDKKEFVLSANRISYGIEIDFCPFCGRKLKDKGWD